MTYLGQDNDFIKSSYSFTLFEAYFRHLLGALPEYSAFFECLCHLHAVLGYHFCIALNLLKYVPFLFKLYVNAILLIFGQ